MTDTHTLSIPNSINLRTLAGYKAYDGRIIKANKILRSGRLSKLSPNEAELLATNYKVVTVADLRTDEEIKREPDVLPQDAAYYQLPVLPFSDHSSFTERLKRRFAKPEDPTTRMYRKMMTDSHATSAYRDLFNLLLNNTEDNQALLIHCSAGKDRTGVAMMLIEAALGIPDDTIRRDYLLSNDLLAASGELNNSEDRSTHADSMRTQPATEENIQAVLNVIHGSYQSWTDYLQRQIGLSTTDLAVLKQSYLLDTNSKN
ncbi:tyrosine-protein phosphatase [Lacticaseibacillus paracasei]|uniref:tyrosine-protein phosphatase n=1 Tax=Lacticaseibacillus paracasei TaxID=1597 RepID=UPI0027384812|nr:tyrosine-protein phosphatase [Lacticaseibacillus paracasei]MDP4467176.1 tyrosine-protein phosphatase [Lacticaseibacillus paracasei]